MFLQGLYTALLSWHNSHVGSYMIPVYDVRSWCGLSWQNSLVGFYMILVYYVRSWCGMEISLDLIMLSFRSVWPSSVDGELSDRSKSPIAIYAIILFCRSRSTWSCYFDDRDVRDRVIFNWSVVRTPGQPVRVFIGPGFNSQARSPVSGQCDSWPMSLAPTNGELGWWGKKTSLRKKNASWLL